MATAVQNAYQICRRCIMDTSDPDIRFDADGVCGYCRQFETIAARYWLPENQRKNVVEDIVHTIQSAGKNHEYDCIIGISGGVDSSYLAFQLKALGCRPLAVHLDNGWNSEIAVKNIELLIRKTGIDLYTYVVDWEEYRDIQLAFLKASVTNAEAPTDHAFRAVLYRTAVEKKIQYFVTGLNVATEGLNLPCWGYAARDFRLIKSIHQRYGRIPIKTFPRLGFFEDFYFTAIKRVREVHLLNYLDYNKPEVVRFLQREFDWKDYGGKHYESVFTRFFQGYILPEKFKIDKRRAHLSNQVQAGQITREEALRQIEEPIYPEELLRQDREFVLKKFGLSEAEFAGIMTEKPRTYKEFRTNEFIYDAWKKLAAFKASFRGSPQRF